MGKSPSVHAVPKEILKLESQTGHSLWFGDLEHLDDKSQRKAEFVRSNQRVFPTHPNSTHCHDQPCTTMHNSWKSHTSQISSCCHQATPFPSDLQRSRHHVWREIEAIPNNLHPHPSAPPLSLHCRPRCLYLCFLLVSDLSCLRSLQLKKRGPVNPGHWLLQSVSSNH